VVANLESKRILDTVSILRVKDTTHILKDVKTGIDQLGGLQLRRDSVVLIKPNLCCIKSAETGATTDVRVVDGIISYLKSEFGISDISIVESDGAQVLADMAFKLLGYERLSRKLSVKLVNLTKSPSVVRYFPSNIYLKEFRVPIIMENADLIISVPKMKIHSDCVLTGSLKNMFGCNPYPRKTVYHNRLDDAIVDINTILKTHLTIVDGIVAMEGCKGPTDGVPIKMNLLVFGRDPVSVDHALARIMGLDPEKIIYLAEAEKRRIGCTSYKIVGEELSEVRREFRNFRPRWSNLLGLFYRDTQDL
jgi:uncharacterized protein (DUF362 family)